MVRDVLDQVGWTAREDLANATLLEPAAGDGEFVVEAATRLIESLRLSQLKATVSLLSNRIVAFEIHARVAEEARARLRQALRHTKLGPSQRALVAQRWVRNEDFLLSEQRHFTHVVGNPPYVRWSKIPSKIGAKYRNTLPRNVCGGDLFLPFLDRSIQALRPGGHLGFVCSDRWQYAAFAEGFRSSRLREVAIIENEPVASTTAYAKDVDAYPSVLILRKLTRKRSVATTKLDTSLWQSLEDMGCSIRVGPALGCTPAFVVDPSRGVVEPELLHPWIDTRQVGDGAVTPGRLQIIVMHEDDGTLRNIRKFPKAGRHFEKHRAALTERSIVQAGRKWFQPIDRVMRSPWKAPKLLIPEISRIPRIAFDYSGAIPSHGLYAILGPETALKEVYAMLEDGGLERAIREFAPRIKGGYYRCYKKILERILLPTPPAAKAG